MDRTHKRCECGGITGICGTQEGEALWRLHQETKEHQKWFENNVHNLPSDEIHKVIRERKNHWRTEKAENSWLYLQLHIWAASFGVNDFGHELYYEVRFCKVSLLYQMYLMFQDLDYAVLFRHLQGLWSQ